MRNPTKPPAPGAAPAQQNGQGPPATDSYFTESRKGEVNELRVLLRTFGTEKDPNRKRDIMKKVIAYMTLGIDVSRLFSDIMLAIETRDLVIKKMVYLFLCNYATSHPDLAQMCTNTLQKDCENDDPMVRGLALRALCSLRLPQMVEYISEPLRKSLTDNHAYVRKTGVMGILKLYHLDKEVFDRCNFVDTLYDMLRDPDASVVSNCIIVLNEIMAKGEDAGMAINRAIMLHLLNRIHEFSEFGIVAVLDLVPRYQPQDDSEAFQIMNLLDPVLKTSNSAAVLATIRAFLSLAGQISLPKKDMMSQVVMRVKAPLVTLAVSGIPELMYCLFKNIDLLIDLCPGQFDDEYRQFFVRYNEPTHVKYLKIQILPKFANQANFIEIVAELAEYVNDTDVRISRLAVRSLASIACNIPERECAEGIVLRLVECLDFDVGHVPSEAAYALALVLRKHPSLKDLITHRLPRALKYVTESKGKCAVLFLLAEFGDSISSAPYAIEKLIDSYPALEASTKMALLTSTLKLFFKRPAECQKMLGRLLKNATEDVSNQDLHDRALLYHRLLKSSPEIAEAVVGGSSTLIPVGRKFAEENDCVLTGELLKEFNTLSIIYGQVSETFIQEEFQVKLVVTKSQEINKQQDIIAPLEPPMPSQQTSTDDVIADLLDFGISTPPPIPTLRPQVTMDGEKYQQLWTAHPEAINAIIPLKKLPDLTSEIETALASFNIQTMASGELPTEFKFFMYAQQNDNDNIILLQAVVEKTTMELTLVVKTDAAPGSILWVQELIKTALVGFV